MIETGLYRILSSSWSPATSLRRGVPVVTAASSSSSSSFLGHTGTHKINGNNNHHYYHNASIGASSPRSSYGIAITTTNSTAFANLSHLRRRTISSWFHPKIPLPKPRTSANKNLPDDHAATVHMIQQEDIGHVFRMVQAHDPAAMLPGRLLPTPELQLAYFAVRSFWVETGLRFGTTANLPMNSTPAQHLDWWSQRYCDHVVRS